MSAKAAQGQLPAVEAHEDWVRVHFGDGTPSHADFHWFWLRHQCDGDRHPLTGERTLDASEVPLDIRPREVVLDEEKRLLRVTWDDAAQRQSTYELAWLKQHVYAADRVDVAPPAAEVSAVTLDGKNAEAEEAAAFITSCLEILERHGLVIVRDFASALGRFPEDDTEPLIETFTAAGLKLVGTHFGRIEDLRTDNTTNQNTDQLGYTDAAIELHTDQPFLENPPRYQLLQCIRPADSGGENHLADALAAARYLEAHDAHAFALLSTIPVRFHRKQKAFERTVVSPILSLDTPGGFRVRYSYFTLAPFSRPFAEMETWYRAYAKFARIVREPRHQYRFRLGAGDFILYDNHRMLHARTGFKGPRWLRGVYFDK